MGRHYPSVPAVSLQGEIWRQIPDFPIGYKVSNLGRVKTCCKVSRAGENWKTPIFILGKFWRVLHQTTHKQGYKQVWVRNKLYFVHRLVLEAFVGPRPPKADTRHLNDIPDDNRLENLKWGTRGQNIQDAIRNGRCIVGENHHSAKLSDDDVRNIRRLLASGKYKQKQIADLYGLNSCHVSDIKTGRRRRHTL